MPRNPQKKLAGMLRRSGAVLLRHKKHFVYKLPDGKRFVTSKTPSDWMSELNAIKRLERMLEGREK